MSQDGISGGAMDPSKPIYSQWKRQSKRAKIGINGFGRIGRMVLRAALANNMVAVTAINDPFLDTNCLCYLMQCDSTHGRLDAKVEKIDDNHILIDGQTIWIYHYKEPGRIPWDEASAVYVVDSSGAFLNKDDASQHFAYAKCKKVILTSSFTDAPIYIMGVNHTNYHPRENIVSCGCGTMQCLSILTKVVNDNFGIAEGLMTSIHAYTSTQKVVDAPSIKAWREGRGCGQNIIPSSVNFSNAIASVFPDLKGRLAGTTFLVPTPDVSVMDLTCILKKPVPFSAIQEAFKNASQTKMKGVLRYVDEEIVSADIQEDPSTCVFDAKAGMMLTNNFVKLVAWHDNEYGYSCRIVDFILYMYLQDNRIF